MDSLLYEDKPRYDIWIKAILAFPLIIILIPGLYSLGSNDTETAIGMFVTAVLMAVIYWAIFPRKYCVFDSKLKIVLGGPFSFNISFSTIESARSPKGMAVGVNFVTSFSNKNAVQIVRRKRLNVNITPGNRELFLENLDKALNNWRSYNTQSA